MSGEVKRIKRECRDWLALLQSGEASAADRARFVSWLRADPRHRQTYTGLHMLCRDIATLNQRRGLAAPRAIPNIVERATRRLLLVAAATLAGFALALFLTQSQ